MKNRLLVCSIVVSLGVGLVSLAQAGQKDTNLAWVDSTYREAEGSFADVRASPDGSQIGCSTDYSSTANPMNEGASYWAYCSATDASGNQAYCYTTDPGFFNVAASLDSDAVIYFAWNTSGVCTSISVYHGSTSSPKQP